MDENLRRVFDQVKPSGEQKEAMLDRLLEPERKGKPMKKLSKLAVIGIAAALLLVTCAAAVVTGLDQRLLDYFGAGAEQAELLAPGAIPVDITVEDNGATFHVTQVLRDKYSILMLADFTAPEGTKLDVGESDIRCVNFRIGASEQRGPTLLDGSGVPVAKKHSISWSLLVLDQPEDNHLSLLYTVRIMDGVAEEAQTISLSNVDLVRSDKEKQGMVTIYTGNWSCEVPLPQNDTGWSHSSGTELELPDAVVYEKGVYLSPMSLELTLAREDGLPVMDVLDRADGSIILEEAVLADKRGQELFVGRPRGGESAAKDEYRCLFELPKIIDPARFQGGTLSLTTLGGQTFVIPLDDLAPAE